MRINSRKDLHAALASTCHDNWSAFWRFLIEESPPNEAGDVVLPASLVELLTQVAGTPYCELNAIDRNYAEADARSVMARLERFPQPDSPVTWQRSPPLSEGAMMNNNTVKESN